MMIVISSGVIWLGLVLVVYALRLKGRLSAVIWIVMGMLAMGLILGASGKVWLW